jgi:CheY-like chemotaxis protein
LKHQFSVGGKSVEAAGQPCGDGADAAPDLAAEHRDPAVRGARHEQPDLIVMDLRLPDISGLEATRLLKKNDQTKNIPIIAVTAFVTPSF